MKPWRGESGLAGIRAQGPGRARRASDDEKGLSWIIRSIGRPLFDTRGGGVEGHAARGCDEQKARAWACAGQLGLSE
jgi:hypothetical protein